MVQVRKARSSSVFRLLAIGACAFFALISMGAPGTAAREGVHHTRHHVSFAHVIRAAILADKRVKAVLGDR